MEEEEEVWPLSDKPFFDVILSKTHLHRRYLLLLPSKMHSLLPSPTIAVVLTYRGKTWETIFSTDRANIVRACWKSFVEDNNLKIGDACVFELEECCSTGMKFKVQILRGDFPDELLAKVSGDTSDCPIIVE